MAGKKMGRPTDNPKPHRIDLRIDDRTHEILMKYCETNKVDRSEAIRRAIGMLADKE